MRKLWVFTMMCAVACGLSACGSASSTSANVKTASASAGHHLAVATCRSSQLSASVSNRGVATGSWYLTGSFRNDVTVACTLRGYPQLQMIGTNGQPVLTRLQDLPSTQLGAPGRMTPTGAQVVTLRPGSEASYTIAAGDGSILTPPLPTCPVTASFQVTPPGAPPGSNALAAPVPPVRGDPHALSFIAYPYRPGEPCGAISVSIIVAGPPHG